MGGCWESGETGSWRKGLCVAHEVLFMISVGLCVGDYVVFWGGGLWFTVACCDRHSAILFQKEKKTKNICKTQIKLNVIILFS